MKITYEDKELYDSAEFIALGLGDTRLRLENERENLEIIFSFLKNEQKQSVGYELVDNSTLRIVCENWNDPLPVTIKGLLEIGTFLSRRLFIIFSVNKMGAEGEFRKVHLSVYLGEEVADDKA